MATEHITKEAAIDKLYKLPCKIDDDGYRWVLSIDAAHMIDETPAADVRPVVRGEWEPAGGSVFPIYACSQCCAISLGGNFCPNCGADMREVKVDGN